jgi:hypothetical protein
MVSHAESPNVDMPVTSKFVPHWEAVAIITDMSLKAVLGGVTSSYM